MKYFACFYPDIDFKYFWWFLFSPWWPTTKLPHADSGSSNRYPDPVPLVPLWAMLVWCEILGYGSTVAEDLSNLVCDTVLCGQIVLDVSKDCSAFIFRVKQDESATFLWNSGNHWPNTHSIICQKTWMLIILVTYKFKPPCWNKEFVRERKD